MIIPAYSNLSEFISNGKSIILTYQNFSFADVFEDIKFPIYNVLQDYISELTSACTTIKLSNDEMVKYKYKPRLLSAHVYGTTELFFLILMVNGMASEKEFNKQVFKLLPKAQVQEMVNKIYIAEESSIDSYNNRLMKEYISE